MPKETYLATLAYLRYAKQIRIHVKRDLLILETDPDGKATLASHVVTWLQSPLNAERDLLYAKRDLAYLDAEETPSSSLGVTSLQSPINLTCSPSSFV